MIATHEQRIVLDPLVMAGKPIIKGTRITVEFILGLLGEGETFEAILQDYPHITREDIFAAIRYATHVVEEERVFPLAEFRYA